MRIPLMILPLVALAACATPREQCIDDATRDTRILTALISQTERNIARGYALEQHQDIRTVPGTCEGRNEDGSTFIFACDETNTFTTTVPVAIDLNAERAKLTSLQERLAQIQPATDQAVAQCLALYAA